MIEKIVFQNYFEPCRSDYLKSNVIEKASQFVQKDFFDSDESCANSFRSL
jgi:hypothetical protein